MPNQFKKTLSILLCGCVILGGGISAYADEPTTKKDTEVSTTQPTTERTLVDGVFEEDEITTTEPSKKDEKPITADEVQAQLEEQRKSLEERLKENESKLESYEESAKETEDYINTLDEKIGYLNEELNLLDREISSAQKKVNAYEKQVKELNEDLADLQERCDKANSELDKLNSSFKSTYNAYCLRLRAMYISGSNSIIVTLLTSKDLSQLISRYEMIKAIAKSDTALLKEVNKKMAKVNEKKQELDSEKAVLDAKSAELNKKQSACEREKQSIESKQQEVASKKITIAEKRAESDALLAKYARKTQQYGEYRNEDEELIASVEKEIDDVLSGLKSPEEATTIASTENSKVDTSADMDSTTGTLFSKNNAVLSLGYPVPHHHSVSAPFGHYSNGNPHTGIDYPCPKGSKVVAAQKGIVIKVRRLNYSYGYYVMIYHGTDSNGRKIVTLYAHNSDILVSVGQSVTKGQQIAKSGSTGNSTGPHCHFELIINGNKVNAKNYLI